MKQLIRILPLIAGLTTAVPQAQQRDALRIVVLEGEGAVNIIQQKSAVAPVVEIRDRNDLPVSGASVTFTLKGGNAAFGGGAQTITVTTNAAGRAAVSGLSPLSPGSVQINVSAAAQGQTASAVITQTNFLTAAAATAAGATVGGATAAAAAGGGAAGGGGLSGVALAGIIGGAAAGGLVAANAAGVIGGESCDISVSPTALTFAGGGGAQNVTIATAEGCEWTAASDANWVVFAETGQTQQATGRGGDSLRIEAAANPFGQASRTATVTVAGTAVTIAQNARCAATVTPTTLNFPSSGGSATIAITVAPAGCDEAEWRVNTFELALEAGYLIAPLSGSGNGVINVTAPANPSFGERTAVIGISAGGQGVIVRFVLAPRS
jgi:hypothetical protein